MERCSGGKDVEVEAAIGEAVAISDQSLEMQSPGYREDVKWEEGVNWTRNADQRANSRSDFAAPCEPVQVSTISSSASATMPSISIQPS